MLKLLHNRVACVPIRDSHDTGIEGFREGKADPGFTKPKSGNIIIPDEYGERVDQGLVKYVGSSVTREKYGFGIGDMVIFSGYSGELVSIEGEGLFILVPAKFIKACVITEPTIVSGLYFRDGGRVGGDSEEYDEHYFPATYEKAMELIALALGETSVLEIDKDRPKLEDYKEVEEEEDE